MAEITTQRAGEMLRALFKILMASPDGLPAAEALKLLENALVLTPFEQADYPKRPGVRRFEKLVRFHSINAVKAGWMVKAAGVWSLTPQGKAAYEQLQDPSVFMREAIRLYREWLKAQPSTASGDSEPSIENEQPDPAATLEDAEDAARSLIEAYLQKMPAYPFQDLVAALLRAMGYNVLWVAPPGPDGGFDVVAQTDPLGARGPRIKAQVKQRSDSKVSPADLRSFMAVLGDQDVGIFISTGGFSKEAEAEARRQEKRRVTLIDLGRLLELWVLHYSALSEVDRQLLPLKPVYFLAPRS
jgi:restriction system protein